MSQALRDLAGRHRRGDVPLVELEAQALAALAARGWEPDYLCVRRRSDLLAPSTDDNTPLVALGAARLGATRLIDNLEF